MYGGSDVDGHSTQSCPNLAAQDGLSLLARATRQPLMLGLFLPLQSGAWTPTTATRGTDWTFDYNAKLMVRADELGFDLAFGLAHHPDCHSARAVRLASAASGEVRRDCRPYFPGALGVESGDRIRC